MRSVLIAINVQVQPVQNKKKTNPESRNSLKERGDGQAPAACIFFPTEGRAQMRFLQVFSPPVSILKKSGCFVFFLCVFFAFICAHLRFFLHRFFPWCYPPLSRLTTFGWSTPGMPSTSISTRGGDTPILPHFHFAQYLYHPHQGRVSCLLAKGVIWGRLPPGQTSFQRGSVQPPECICHALRYVWWCCAHSWFCK